MKALEDYIAFDLEFNQYEGTYQIIQVSAVRFAGGQEVKPGDMIRSTKECLINLCQKDGSSKTVRA